MYYVHINRNVIDSNRKNGTNDPPITIKSGRSGRAIPARDVRIRDGRVHYSIDPILPCGARVVIETEEAPEIVS